MPFVKTEKVLVTIVLTLIFTRFFISFLHFISFHIIVKMDTETKQELRKLAKTIETMDRRIDALVKKDKEEVEQLKKLINKLTTRVVKNEAEIEECYGDIRALERSRNLLHEETAGLKGITDDIEQKMWNNSGCDEEMRITELETVGLKRIKEDIERKISDAFGCFENRLDAIENPKKRSKTSKSFYACPKFSSHENKWFMAPVEFHAVHCGGNQCKKMCSEPAVKLRVADLALINLKSKPEGLTAQDVRNLIPSGEMKEHAGKQVKSVIFHLYNRRMINVLETEGKVDFEDKVWLFKDDLNINFKMNTH